jgi:ribosomal protein S1
MSHVPTAVWQDFLAEHGAGRPFDAVVTKVLPFGALIESGHGVPGLLPRGAWADEPVHGSTISVRVANADVEQRRVSVAPA